MCRTVVKSSRLDVLSFRQHNRVSLAEGTKVRWLFFGLKYVAKFVWYQLASPASHLTRIDRIFYRAQFRTIKFIQNFNLFAPSSVYFASQISRKYFHSHVFRSAFLCGKFKPDLAIKSGRNSQFTKSFGRGGNFRILLALECKQFSGEMQNIRRDGQLAQVFQATSLTPISWLGMARAQCAQFLHSRFEKKSANEEQIGKISFETSSVSTFLSWDLKIRLPKLQGIFFW